MMPIDFCSAGKVYNDWEVGKMKGFLRKGKKGIVFLLLAVLLCIALAGCGKQTGGKSKAAVKVNPDGFPIVDKTLKLKIVTMQTPVQKDFNDMVILKDYEKKSNIDVDWVCIPQEFVAERRNIMMASAEELPDAFFKMQFPATDISKYSKQGLILPLSDLIDQYAPNVRAAFKKWPDVEKGLTMPDGKIYSLGYILGAPAITSGPKLFFNSEALRKVNKEVPTTLDAFVDVLKAFKDLDYNENGKADEVPLTCSDYGGLEGILKGSFGLGTRGSAHGNVDVDPDTSELRFIPTSEGYKQLLQFMHMLYQEHLLDQEIFTMDMPKLIAKGEEGRALCYAFVNHSVIGTKYSEKSVGLEAPLKGPNGDLLWNNSGPALSGFGHFVITKKNPNPEATMRWEDYWYSDDGMREYFMGVKDKTYYVDDNGNYEYTDYVMKNPDGIMFEQVLGAYVPWAGGANPSIAGDKYFKGGEMQPITKASADKLYEYRPKTIWPGFVWEDKDTDDMASIATDLSTYINENRALFVTGKKSFDEWDDYVKGFDNMRLDHYMKVYKDAAKRYGFKG